METYTPKLGRIDLSVNAAVYISSGLSSDERKKLVAQTEKAVSWRYETIIRNLRSAHAHEIGSWTYAIESVVGEAVYAEIREKYEQFMAGDYGDDTDD